MQTASRRLFLAALPGGRGAVRDAVEWLLKLTGAWSDLVAKFRA